MSKSVRIGKKREELIEKLGVNFSEFVRRQIDNKLKNPEILKQEIRELNKKIEERQKLIEEIEEERTNFNSEEKEYLRESKEILDKYGEDSDFFNKRFIGFIEKFKKEHIGLDLFKNIVSLYS